MITDETGAQRYATTDEVVRLVESGNQEVQRLQTELQMSQFQIISKNSEITFYEKKMERMQVDLEAAKASAASAAKASEDNGELD